MTTSYRDHMAVERITISIDRQLGEAVRQAAADDNTNVSVWASQALQRSLASRGLSAVISDWEAQHGAFTPLELDQARQGLGW
jgi:hypothetical protein